MAWNTKDAWFLMSALAVLSPAPNLKAQPYLPKARVTHSSHETTIVARDPRPLDQAITAVGEEYGWVIDYEDPVYSDREARDAASPGWRRTHPTEQGLLLPSGGEFVATLRSGAMANKDKDKKVDTLKSLLTQYNASSNPGQFQLIHTQHGRVVVSGRPRGKRDPIPGALDTILEPSPEKQTATLALQDVVKKCSAGREVAITLGIIPVNALNQTVVTGSKGSLSCRSELGRVLNALPYQVEYRLLYDIGSRSYVLSIVPAHHLVTGANGESTLVPLQKTTSRR